MTSKKEIYEVDLGLIDYESSFSIQKKFHQKLLEREISDVIILQECYPVITIGKSGSEDNLIASIEELKEEKIKVIYTNRGGDITYHGPGQLIISPVLYLRNHMRSIIKYLRDLEETVINLLGRYGIEGEKIENASGVWVNNKKIGAIGIALKNGVTQHGVAININPNLSHFNFIIPCGLQNTGITSLEELGVKGVDIHQVKKDFLQEFSAVFNVNISKNSLYREVLKDEL